MKKTKESSIKKQFNTVCFEINDEFQVHTLNVTVIVVKKKNNNQKTPGFQYIGWKLQNILGVFK